MRRYWPYFLLAMFLGAFGLRLVYAALSPAAYMPTVRNGQAAPTPTPAFHARLVKLVDQDCGFVNAVAYGGRVFVDYQTRPDGKVHLTEQIGDVLLARPEPPFSLAPLIAPQTELPGPKQGSVSQIIVGNQLRTYFTGRAADDPSGPFFVWVLIEPIPPPPPTS